MGRLMDHPQSKTLKRSRKTFKVCFRGFKRRMIEDRLIVSQQAGGRDGIGSEEFPE